MFAVKFNKSMMGNDAEFVAGFDSQMYIVQTTRGLEYAKTWKTARAAEKFVQKYADAGYGLTADMVEVVSL
jgi:hypothetical protein